MMKDKDLFKIKHNSTNPEKGKILISEPFMRDIFFQRSVILLIEHGPNGSMGFVLNNNTGLFLNDYIEGLDKVGRIPIFLGGPVSSDHLFFIHSMGQIIPDSVQIDDNLYFDGDFESLNYYLLSGQPVEGKIKFFLGYAGWSKSQLIGEIKHDSWLVGQTSDRAMLLAKGESFWKKSVESIGGPYLAWLNYPKDPLLN